MTLSTWHRNLPITWSSNSFANSFFVRLWERCKSLGGIARETRETLLLRKVPNQWYMFLVSFVSLFCHILICSISLRCFDIFCVYMAICSRKGRLYNIDSRCLFSLGHFRIASLHLRLGCVGHHHEMLLVLTSWLLASRCSGQICCL